MRWRSGRSLLIALAVCTGIPLAVVAATSAVDSNGGRSTTPGQAIALPPDVGVTNVAVPIPFGTPQVVASAKDSVLLVSAGWPPGSPRTNAGAAYQPSTGTWTTIAPLPTPMPLANADGVWLGDRLIVGGVQCGSSPEGEADELHCDPGTLTIAWYSPDDDKWELLDAPPETGSLDTRFGDWGEAVGVTTSQVAVFRFGSTYWTLDPQTRAWTQLPDSPIAQISQSCVVGTSLVAVSATPGDPVGDQVKTDQGVIGISTYAGAQVSSVRVGEQTWGPAVPVEAALDSLDYPQMLCSDADALLYSHGLSHAWTYDPTTSDVRQVAAPSDDLRNRPGFDGPVPVNLPTVFRAAAWTGKNFVFWNPETNVSVDADPVGDPKAGGGTSSTTAHRPGNAVALDPTSLTWAPAAVGQGGTTQLYPHQVAWTDGYAFVPTVIDNKPILQIYRPI